MPEISGIATAANSVAANDELAISQSGTTRRVTADKFAVRGLANIYTKTQTVNPDTTGASAINGTMPTNTSGEVLDFYYSTQRRIYIRQRANSSEMRLLGFDNGSAAGPNVVIERNGNASTPAPGHLVFQRANGTYDYIYPDDSANLRTLGGLAPNNANIGNGIVIGTQTSHVDYKHVLGAPVSDAEALLLICEAAAQVARFVYRNGSFGGEEFSGVILDGDTLHRYGMDADEEHPAGKSLNVINALGDLFLAVRGLAERVAALEAQLG